MKSFGIITIFYLLPILINFNKFINPIKETNSKNFLVE